jgi:hypothetical protein
MIGTTEILVGGAVLGAGTYAYRVAGPLLHVWVTPSVRVQSLMTVAATVLLFALAVTSALMDGTHLADPARPAGVAVGAVLAWRRAPFVVVVLAAAATAAALRLVLP